METQLVNRPCTIERGTDICPEHGPHNDEYCKACQARKEIRAIADEIDIDDGSYISAEDLRLKAANLREIVASALGASEGRS